MPPKKPASKKRGSRKLPPKTGTLKYETIRLICRKYDRKETVSMLAREHKLPQAIVQRIIEWYIAGASLREIVLRDPTREICEECNQPLPKNAERCVRCASRQRAREKGYQS